MKIIRLIQSEFVKNYSVKKLVIITLIMLIVSIGFVEINDFFYSINSSTPNSYIDSSDRFKNNGDESLENEYMYRYTSKRYEYNKYLGDNYISSNDYRTLLVQDKLDYLVGNNIAADILLKNRDKSEIKNICDTSTQYFGSSFQGQVHHLCTVYTIEELEKYYLESTEEIKDYEYILKSNKYYLYVEYQLNNGLIDDSKKEMANFIISNKIEDSNNLLALNYRLYDNLIHFDTESCDLVSGYYISQEFGNYDNCIRYYKYRNNLYNKQSNIIKYSTFNNIKHDVSIWHDEEAKNYEQINGKRSVNLIFHFSVVVMVLVSITSSGIVSNEHNRGTIKNIITAPVRRWKILLSKFIYLILHSYIIWLIGLVFISIYSGMKYGFSDLITPKLIDIGGNVIEVNYYLHLLKDLFIASIPVICFLSILFFLSTVTLNTSLTVGITSILAILSPVYWYIAFNFKLYFLVKTPLLYFDTAFIHHNMEWYDMLLKKADININNGIIISLVITIILYIISNIVYLKRDIKN